MSTVSKAAARPLTAPVKSAPSRGHLAVIWLALLWLGTPMLATSICSSAAIAHPHVWIKVKTELIVSGGTLTGLRHTWVFDQSWLASQLEEHDKDKDGLLTAQELAPLIAESRETLETFKSFTIVRAGGNIVRAVKPRDVSIDYHGALLGMTFTASLAKPLPLKGELLLEVYDAGYFSSFTFDGAEAVTFSGVVPEGCTVKSGVSPSPQQMRDYRQMLKEIGRELSKPFTPQSVAVSCVATQTTPASRDPANVSTSSPPLGASSSVAGSSVASPNAEIGPSGQHSPGNSTQLGNSGIVGFAARAGDGTAGADGLAIGGQVSGAPNPLPPARFDRSTGSR